MANLILTIGVTVLSFCVVIFFTIAFANAIEYLIAKHNVERFMEEETVIELEDDCCHCCHCCSCKHDEEDEH